MVLRWVIFGCLAAAVLPASTTLAQFTDVTGVSGVPTTGVREGGACFADVDRDGDADAYVPAEAGAALLVNDGTGSFEDRTATAIAGLGQRRARRGCAFGDLNHDGLVDLVRTDTQVFEVYLNRSEAGVLAFGTASGAPDFFIDGEDGIGDPLTTNFEGLGMLDADRDGFLDIAVQNESGVRIFHNEGDGSLTLVSGNGLPEAAGNGDFLTVADIDGDADTDIVARLLGGGDLFLNDGDGTFTGAPLGLEADRFNKGATIVCDFDNDGQFDLFHADGVAGPRVNRVLLQEDGVFSPTAVPNIAGNEVEGATCGDVDHDGDLDLIVNLVTSTQLYVNQLAESGSFDLTRDDRGLTGVPAGQAVSLADIDGDGDLDVFVAGSGPNALFRNGIDDEDYLIVRPWAEVGACPAGSVRREDLGAVVRLLDDGGDLLAMREISGGAGRGRMEEPIAHFGLPEGPDQSYQVRVRFQYGGTEITVPVIPAGLNPPQRLDVSTSDADGDTILDTVEQALGNPDPDGDGVEAWLDLDSDGDGVADAIEAGDVDPCTPPIDNDSNGVADYVQAPDTPDAGVPPDAGPPGAPLDGGPLPEGGAPAPVDAANGAPDVGVGPGPVSGESGLELRGGGIAGCHANPSGDGTSSGVGLLVLMLLAVRLLRGR